MLSSNMLKCLKEKMHSLRGDVEKYRTLHEEKCCAFELERSNRIKAEDKLASYMRTLQLLEDENHQLESRYQQVVNKLNEVSMDLDEFKRIQKVNLSRQIIDEEKILILENQIQVLKTSIDEAEQKHREVEGKLSLIEDQYESSEERREIAESKVHQLDEELQTTTNNLRSLQIIEQTLASKEENYENTISELRKKLKESQDVIENQAREITCKSWELEKTERSLIEKEKEYTQLREELEACYRDLEDL